MEAQVLYDFNKNLAAYYASKPLYLDEPKQKKPNTRKLVELPWQHTKGEMWDEVTNTLCNLDFIQAKAAKKMTYELIDDFNNALSVIPDNQINIQNEAERQNRLMSYINNLVEFAQGTVPKLEIPKSAKPWDESRFASELDRFKNGMTGSAKLKYFLGILGIEATNLQNFAIDIPNFSIQQFWNSGQFESPIRISSEIKNRLLLLNNNSRPAINPFPTIIKTLKGYKGSVFEVQLLLDGKHAYCNSEDGTILWDLQRGKEMPTDNLLLLREAVTPDLRIALTEYQNSIVLYDVRSGNIIRTLRKRDKKFIHHIPFSISSNGKVALTGSDDDTCVFWNLVNGDIIYTLKGHTNTVTDLSMTPDARFAVSASSDGTCILWDLSIGIEIKRLRGHTSQVSSIAITPDGALAISGSWDTTCILWDLASGKELKRLRGHSGQINSVSISPDGKRALSGSNDTTCIFWDLESGFDLVTDESLAILSQGDINYKNEVRVSPDGNWAVSITSDSACFLWDLSMGGVKNKIGGEPNPTRHTHFTFDSKRLLLSPERCDSDFILVDINSGNEVHRTKYKGHDEFHGLTPDSNFILLRQTNGFFKIINTFDGKVANPDNKDRIDNRPICFSPDGRYLMAGSSFYDLKTGLEIATLDRQFIETGLSQFSNIDEGFANDDSTVENYVNKQGIKSVSISPDGKLVFAGYEDGICILCNLQSGKLIRTFKHHYGKICSVAIVPNGRFALSISDDNQCIQWDLKSGEIKNKVSIGQIFSQDSDSSQKPRGIGWIRARQPSIQSITSDSSRALLIINDTFILWNLVDGEKLAIYASNSIIDSVAKFQNGLIVGCNSGKTFLLNIDNKILYPELSNITIRQIWDFESGQYSKQTADCPLCGHRYVPPTKVINCISKILEINSHKPKQSSYFELDDEVWNNSSLIGECPNCQNKLMYNPFFVEIEFKQVGRISFSVDCLSKEKFKGLSTKHDDEFWLTTDQLADAIKTAFFNPSNTPNNELDIKKDNRERAIQETLKEEGNSKLSGHEQKYQLLYFDAEKAFNNENWEVAYNTYLQLVQQGKFDINDMRYKMALCRINCLTAQNQEIIKNINILVKLLQEKGESEKVIMINAKLKARIDSLEQEERAKNKAGKPWWKR